MARSTYNWHLEHIVPVLMCGGLFTHLMNLAHYFEHGTTNIDGILLPWYDGPLTLLMLYCSVAMIAGWRGFFARFGLKSRGRRIGYGLIAFYVTASLPGHVGFLLTGDNAYFKNFPWWFSLAILPLYLSVIGYFASLQTARQTRPQRQAA